MTKHWGGHSMLAPPVTAYRPTCLETKEDHHLGFPLDSNAHSRYPQNSILLRSPAPHWNNYPSTWPAQEPSWSEDLRASATAIGVKVSMDPAMPEAYDRHPASYYTAPASEDAQESHRTTWDQEENAKNSSRKKNYQRYPKPPYSYLAMIAMVIQNSPEKKLTLSQILKEISTLFPFFKGNYKGWKDSVRHNLSSYDCFVKVLKDPGKPQGKGNFWAVEVSRVPLELLKRQNTAVSRQDETIFAQDLAPYILHGHDHKETTPPLSTRAAPPPLEEVYRPKLDSSFAIDSLLHSLRPASLPGEGDRVRDSWRGHPQAPRYSSSARSASASSVSPASSSSDDDWRVGSHLGKRRPDGDGYEDCRPPVHKSSRRGSAPPWELPTSYAKYTPPNAVAPPSMRFSGGPFLPLGGLPYYSYRGPPAAPGHYVGHSYWPLLPSGSVPLQPPPLLMDLDRLLQSVPPNKSVFDVLSPTSPPPHPTQGQYGIQTRYPQY
ncbi:forkhead box protein H1 [Paramormyrops kingsleyae]|uniref:forkhead box protein H1 n=1 Tax=Paramormyrops kingsleyae TaxID=1676925 RepID=UPI003B972A3D